jgi:hypothetical protein
MLTRIDANNRRWAHLADLARQLEVEAKRARRLALSTIVARYPEISHTDFSALARAAKNGTLPQVVCDIVLADAERIRSLTERAKAYRRESKLLLEAHIAADTRPHLNPLVDMIPPNEYPKLRDCSCFPLRLSCDHGENDRAKWHRCEYMKYDVSKGRFDPQRWVCTAPVRVN